MSARASMLTPHQMTIMRDWGDRVREMFPGKMPYLVGSVLHKPDWRDIDVRLIFDDEELVRLARLVDVKRLNLSVTVWGERVTGLPIDFQLQSMTAANDDSANAGPRLPLVRFRAALSDE